MYNVNSLLMFKSRKIVIAVGGASGAIYAKILLDKLATIREQWEKIGIVMSDNAKYNWEYELGDATYNHYPYNFYSKNDFMAPFASGSAQYDTMIAVPCSMGLLGRIAGGVSDDLSTRAADVILKERRRLILVTRETPLSLIHIQNMEKITLAGGIICPATPSFYAHASTIEDLVATVVDRVLILAGFDIQSYQWKEN